MNPLCVDVEHAAEAIGVSATAVRAFIDQGLLPVVKFPSVKHADEKSRRVLIAVEDLVEFIRKYREPVVGKL